MARGVNKVILVGNLGRDPEIRYTPSNNAIANVTIATSDSRKDKQSGEWVEQTEWHRVVFFGRLAEVAGEYLRKGSQVYIEGRLQTRKWTDKDGVEKYSTEIIANEMQMLGGRGGSGGGSAGFDDQGPGSGGQRSQPAPSQRQPSGPSQAPMDDFDDDIPF